MTSNARPDNRILGSLRSADGRAVVRMEDRLDADIDAVWSAFTEPPRLARWLGEVAGDLCPAVSSGFTFTPADRKAPGASKCASARGGCC